jgi:hypothetical protein
MTDDPFYSSKFSIDRAKHHFHDFERELKSFDNPDPYAHVVEFDAKTSENVHKYKLVKAVPPIMNGLVVDCINNLRAALDQAVNAIATLANTRDTYFPFAGSDTEFANTVKGRLKKPFPEEITKLIAGFKPYQGGNDLLWALSMISGANKHSIIRPVATIPASVVMNGTVSAGSFGGNWDSGKNEMILARVPIGREVNMKFTVTSFIAMGDVQVVGGQPADVTLDELIRIVEGIVAALEDETKRLGLIK